MPKLSALCAEWPLGDPSSCRHERAGAVCKEALAPRIHRTSGLAITAFYFSKLWQPLPGSGSRLGLKLIKENVGKPSAQKPFVTFPSVLAHPFWRMTSVISTPRVMLLFRPHCPSAVLSWPLGLRGSISFRYPLVSPWEILNTGFR